MCGIAGIFNLDGKEVDKNVLHQMDEVLAHRGSDDHGEYIDRNIGLANRRLAIIDLSASGHQPLKTKDGLLWITFNGEIFNYQQIKSNLLTLGYQFSSNSDTEVILYGYRHYSQKIVEKLLGQFAFCIWDKNKERLFLARDQLGVNPLYYVQIGKTFIFASEVKALLASGYVKREVDQQSLYHYLSIFTIPAPLTIVKDVKSLLPGHTMIVDKNGIRIKKCWEIPVTRGQNKTTSYKELKEQLRENLLSAISFAKVADVPVGVFLSGGIDSSTVMAIYAQMMSNPIKTFSLWAEGGESFDERRFAQIIAKKYKTEHTEFTISQKELANDLPKIVYFFDQPTGGSIEAFFVAKHASSKVKVALSGLGGDELFAGYHEYIYRTQLLADIYQFVPPKVRLTLLSIVAFLPLSLDIKKTLQLADKLLSIPEIVKRRLFFYYAYNEKEKKKLLNYSVVRQVSETTDSYMENIFKIVSNLPLIDQLSFLDLQTYTRDDLLLGLNMMTMANSLEARVPLLDPRLVEFSFKIPPQFKYRHGISKFILKEVVKEWLPKEIITHKKTGFGLPRVKYMRGILKPYILSLLSKENVKKRGFFNLKAVEEEVTKFYSEKSSKMLWSEHLRVWILFVFELWCCLYLDRKKVALPRESLEEITLS